jgi:hypothetical protein
MSSSDHHLAGKIDNYVKAGFAWPEIKRLLTITESNTFQNSLPSSSTSLLSNPIDNLNYNAVWSSADPIREQEDRKVVVNPTPDVVEIPHRADQGRDLESQTTEADPKAEALAARLEAQVAIVHLLVGTLFATSLMSFAQRAIMLLSSKDRQEQFWTVVGLEFLSILSGLIAYLFLCPALRRLSRRL